MDYTGKSYYIRGVRLGTQRFIAGTNTQYRMDSRFVRLNPQLRPGRVQILSGMRIYPGRQLGPVDGAVLRTELERWCAALDAGVVSVTDTKGRPITSAELRKELGTPPAPAEEPKKEEVTQAPAPSATESVLLEDRQEAAQEPEPEVVHDSTEPLPEVHEVDAPSEADVGAAAPIPAVDDREVPPATEGGEQAEPDAAPSPVIEQAPVEELPAEPAPLSEPEPEPQVEQEPAKEEPVEPEQPVKTPGRRVRRRRSEEDHGRTSDPDPVHRTDDGEREVVRSTEAPEVAGDVDPSGTDGESAGVPAE